MTSERVTGVTALGVVVGALDEEVGDDLLVALGGNDAAVVGVELMAAFLKAGEVLLELGKVMGADDAWFSQDAAGAFHVHEAGGAIELKLELGASEEVEDGEIVLAKMQMLEAVEQFFDVAKEVRKNQDEGALPDFLRELMQPLNKGGVTGGLHSGEHLENMLKMRRIAARRNVKGGVGGGWIGRVTISSRCGEAVEAHGVTLVNEQVGKGRHEPAGVVEFGRRTRITRPSEV